MLLDYIKLKDIKTELSAYVKEAEFLLDLSDIPSDKVVHDVRVLMKKSRAAIKLVRSQTENEFFTREYLTFREAGRIMRSWREASVTRKLLKEFRKKYPDVFKHLGDHEKINLLIRKPEPVREVTPEVRNDLENIRLQLKKSGFRIRFQRMNNLDTKLLLNELEVTYSLVRDHYLTARNDPDANNLHEFRKKAKDFLYQLCFFRMIKPKVVKELENKIDIMTSDLGRYNDLAGVIRALDYKYSLPVNASSLDELVVRIRQEQDKCLMKIWPAAFKIFCPGQKLLNILGLRLLVL
jgi:CHAD domain-containing protein